MIKQTKNLGGPNRVAEPKTDNITLSIFTGHKEALKAENVRSWGIAALMILLPQVQRDGSEKVLADLKRSQQRKMK